MDDGVRAGRFDRRHDALPVEGVRAHRMSARGLKGPDATLGPGHSDDLVTAVDSAPRERAAENSGGPGDEDPHDVSSRSVSWRDR